MYKTPLLKQYFEIADKYKDSIILMQVGDFYESYGKNAEIVSSTLNLVLTKRSDGPDNKVFLCGFPHHASDVYIPKLVKSGYKVAVYDQLEDVSQVAKGALIKRGLTEMITPGLVTEENVLSEKKNNYLAAIYFQKDSIGIAFLDLSTGEFSTTQDTENIYIQKLIYNFLPNEIIFCQDQKQELENLLPNYKGLKTAQQDWIYKEKYATELINKCFDSISIKGFGLNEMPNATITCGAIFQYLKETGHERLQHITKISRILKDNYLWLDKFTIANLELVFSQHEDGKSLFSVLDKNITPMGSRLLRKWLIFPLKQRDAILKRQALVEEFYNENELRFQIFNELHNIVDIERICNKISSRRISPKEMMTLGISLQRVSNIATLLKEKSVDIRFNDHSDLIDKIKKIIKEDFSSNDDFINFGVNEELDEYKKLKTNSETFLNELLQKEILRTAIPSLKIVYNRIIGYYFEVTNVHKDKAPEDWILKQTLTTGRRYTSVELKEYEDKILNANFKITELENSIFGELIDSALEHIEGIIDDAKNIAYLDCLTNFAQLAYDYNYVKPNITTDGRIDIKQGRHPVIERCLAVDEIYIPNDVFLDNDSQQVIILSGPNMVGKSAVLRQTALIVILAQMGAYVPAASADICIVDKIFTRVGASDNISSGESTFMVEMTETSIIMNNLTSQSLVILDEIGRGTSTHDGISIACALVKYLHENKVKTLFATHYHELSFLEGQLERVKNFHMVVKNINGNIIFVRKLARGSAESSFGINVAKLAGMPQSIISSAQKIMRSLQNGELKFETKKDDGEFDDDTKFDNLKKLLDGIDLNNITPLEALNKLCELKLLVNKI